jgi:uncharacterized protein
VSVFADSSALVKLYVPETGHEQVRAIPAPLVVSSLARVELPAAFWGKHRAGEIEADDAGLLTTAFEYDYHGDQDHESTFAIVPVSEAILIDAARQAARHGLRAHDAVQLASAVAARAADDSIDSITVFDKLLRAAAIAEGFAIIGAEAPLG